MAIQFSRRIEDPKEHLIDTLRDLRDYILLRHLGDSLFKHAHTWHSQDGLFDKLKQASDANGVAAAFRECMFGDTDWTANSLYRAIDPRWNTRLRRVATPYDTYRTENFLSLIDTLCGFTFDDVKFNSALDYEDICDEARAFQSSRKTSSSNPLYEGPYIGDIGREDISQTLRDILVFVREKNIGDMHNTLIDRMLMSQDDLVNISTPNDGDNDATFMPIYMRYFADKDDNEEYQLREASQPGNLFECHALRIENADQETLDSFFNPKGGGREVKAFYRQLITILAYFAQNEQTLSKRFETATSQNLPAPTTTNATRLLAQADRFYMAGRSFDLGTREYELEFAEFQDKQPRHEAFNEAELDELTKSMALEIIEDIDTLLFKVTNHGQGNYGTSGWIRTPHQTVECRIRPIGFGSHLDKDISLSAQQTRLDDALKEYNLNGQVKIVSGDTYGEDQIVITMPLSDYNRKYKRACHRAGFVCPDYTKKALRSLDKKAP